MDLKEFYFENIDEKEYHYRFFEFIKNINIRHNIFDGDYDSKEYEFEIFDGEEAIIKFKSLCEPNEVFDSDETICWFYLVTYYLFKTGYEIKEFPRLLARPPKEPSTFTCGEIRNWIIKQGEDDEGTVRYATRRKYVESLTFEQKINSLDIPDSLDQKFIAISNRQASFNNMSVDEKLAEISNLIENFLKRGDNFYKPDYSKICLDYISNDTVTSYRKKMQCFRHAAKESINERKAYTKEQKDFLIDYGIIIVKTIHLLLEN